MVHQSHFLNSSHFAWHVDWINRSNHWLVFSSCFLDHSPKRVFFNLIVIQDVWGEACQVEECLIWLATFNNFVAAIDLCISFFEYLHPDLILSRVSREEPTVLFRSCIEGEVVINDDIHWLSIHIKLDCVCSRLSYGFGMKHIFYSMWVFSNSTESWQEITVSKRTLCHIWSLHSGKQAVLSPPINLIGTLPVTPGLPFFPDLSPTLPSFAEQPACFVKICYIRVK